MIPAGRSFYKMSGSGNDFVMVDARTEAPGRLTDAGVIQALCARGTGVGADGIVFLERSESADLRLTYLNADGSRAALCGNATLCTARLAVELGAAPARGFRIETDSGPVGARIDAETGAVEIDLQPVADVRRTAEGIDLASGERQIGFALAGVPHLVILCDDIATVDVVGRGRPLRSHPSLVDGANVNFVAPAATGGWRMRTYERGVEAETLACGSGAVATAILLTDWGLAEGPVELTTRSGRTLRVRLRAGEGGWYPSLAGEARVVFAGTLSEI
jgi:diaminopimelate epimerase